MNTTMIILLTAGCCLLTFSLCAQNFDEWFFQKKTRRKYLAAQILELEAYLATDRKGWEIGEDGCRTITDNERAELDQLKAFYDSRKNVKPIIADLWKGEISRMRNDVRRIVEDWRQTRRSDPQCLFLTPEFLAQVDHALENALSQLTAYEQEAARAFNDGSLQLSDDERMILLRSLFDLTAREVQSLRQFMENTIQFIVQRSAEAGDILHSPN